MTSTQSQGEYVLPGILKHIGGLRLICHRSTYLAPPISHNWKRSCRSSNQTIKFGLSSDVNGDLAELYGYVNRSLPDNQLDAFVDALAARISSFDKQAIAETKRLVDVNSLPPDAEIVPEWEAFTASLGRPAAQARIRALFERGFHEPGDVETRLGYHVGLLGRVAADARS